MKPMTINSGIKMPLKKCDGSTGAFVTSSDSVGFADEGFAVLVVVVGAFGA